MQTKRSARRASAVGLAALIVAATLGVTGARADGEREILFHSPSGNLVCDIWAQVTAPDPRGLDNAATCTIRHWDIAPDRPFMFTLYANGRVHGQRVTRPSVSGKVLRYGRSIRLHFIRCTSKMSGMRCVSLRSRHGFFMSRSKAFDW
jgi:hypothetical protein